MGVFLQDLRADTRGIAGARGDFGSPGFHEDPPVGFLLVAAFHHVDTTGKVEESCGEG